MAAFVKELQTKIHRLRIALEKTRKKVAELKANEDALTLDLAAAERLLASERPKRGRKPKERTPQPQPSLPTFHPSGPTTNGTNGHNKTALALNLMKSADGASADEIFAAFQQQGITAKKNYVFNIISRLKQQEKIEKRGERFYLKQ